jgi:integrase/recombinase XerD
MLYEDYLTNLKVNGKSKNTIHQYTFLFKKLNEWKPLESWDKATMNEYILKLQNEGYSKATIETRKTILKALFKWAKKSEVIEDIKIKVVKSSLKRKDILDIQDVNTLIDTTESPMYKALIALLFESGGRINEVLPIILDEIEETDKGMILPMHQTKTGEEDRRVLCIFSAQYIRNHITYSGLGKKDRLFPVADGSVWEMLKKLKEKSGIKKPVHAHSFRHSQAVDMLKRGYQDQITKKKLGWKDDSKMLAKYTHVVDDDVINASLAMSGTDIPRQPITNLKQAESLKIADASLQMSKITEENEILKTKVSEMENANKNNAQELNGLRELVLKMVEGNKKMHEKPVEPLHEKQADGKDYPEIEVKEWQLVANGEQKNIHKALVEK